MLFFIVNMPVAHIFVHFTLCTWNRNFIIWRPGHFELGSDNDKKIQLGMYYRQIYVLVHSPFRFEIQALLNPIPPYVCIRQNIKDSHFYILRCNTLKCMFQH